jgi:putative membrane-bound dehydrogenase-like protein
MRRLSFIVLIVFAANPQAGAAQPPDAQSPADSLKCIQTRPGFTVELMAAEPLVMSPIAFAWGADGKFWVVEMGDYPLGVDGKGKPGGRVKFLEKTKPGDGPYGKATVFLDGLAFPTGVTPYGKGVLITCAPDIFYAEDTDGDGKADKKEVLFTGFREGNQQHRVNGLVWGLDNWFYGANGDSGGKVKSLKTGKVVDISGRDFRLKPESGEFEAVTGQTQFGRCRDDWGNWFGNNNSNPLYHFVLDDHYLRRNPYLLPPDPRVPVSVTPGASEVFPTSKPLPRFNSPQALNHFTSACSAIIYRDDLFGPEFVGNSFVSEPVHNLIHREIVKPKGVTFTSQRADDEQKSEFLASSDNWFRPTTIATGPDGALWIADMYRYVIEHPEWIPKDWQAKLDLRAGQDKGRIYRVYPKDKKPHEIVRMDKKTVKELALDLYDANGWTRDTAQQLLLEAGMRENTRIEARRLLLNELVTGSRYARLHALSTLDALNHLALSDIIDRMADPHPAVRKQALRCLERFDQEYWVRPKLQNYLLRLCRDPNAQVRMALAYTLGECPIQVNSNHLATLLREERDDRYIRTAALSSIGPKNARDVVFAMQIDPMLPLPLFLELVPHVAPYGAQKEFAGLLKHNLPAKTRLDAEAFRRLAEVFDALSRDPKLISDLLKKTNLDGTEDLLSRLKTAHGEARRVAVDAKSPASDRGAAVRLLGHGIADDREDYKLLGTLLTPQTPDELQAQVIRNLAKSVDPLVARLLLSAWKGYSPTLRAQAIDVLVSRPAWARQLADALENKQVSANEIDTPRRERLLQHKDAEVREIATKVFASASSPNRGKLVDEYFLTLPDKTDAQRGAQLFAKNCAACHKLGEVGQQVGPDLASVGDKSVQGLLIAILDPNRNVEAKYVNYLAVTQDASRSSASTASRTACCAPRSTN